MYSRLPPNKIDEGRTPLTVISSIFSCDSGAISMRCPDVACKRVRWFSVLHGGRAANLEIREQSEIDIGREVADAAGAVIIVQHVLDQIRLEICARSNGARSEIEIFRSGLQISLTSCGRVGANGVDHELPPELGRLLLGVALGLLDQLAEDLVAQHQVLHAKLHDLLCAPHKTQSATTTTGRSRARTGELALLRRGLLVAHVLLNVGECFARLAVVFLGRVQQRLLQRFL